MPTLEGAKSDCEIVDSENERSHTNDIATVALDSVDGNKLYSCDAASDSASIDVSKSDSHSSGISGFEAQLDPLRFRSIFLQVVEELRMRRDIDVENDSRIKELIANSHELQKSLEEEKDRSVSLMDEHSRAVQDLRLDYDEKMKHAQNEKAKIHITAENWDNELKALKDEIRALHLVKYNLEKKVTEQERQLHLQVSYRDTYLSQMNELDQKCTAVVKQADDISEQIEKLETNVSCTKDLHLKLQYVNEHQKCELDMCRGKLEACQTELMEARVKGSEGQLSECASHEGLTVRNKATDQEIRMQTELNKQLQEQLSSLRNEYQDVLRQLKDSHLLIEKQAQCLTAATTNEDVLRKDVSSLTEKVDKLNSDMESSKEVQQSLQEKVARDNDLWSVKYKDVESRLKSLQEDYTTLQVTHEKDSESNLTNLKDAQANISGLEEQVQCLQAQLNSAKLETAALQEKIISMELKGDKVPSSSSAVTSQDAINQEQASLCRDSKSSPVAEDMTTEVHPMPSEGAGHSPEVLPGSQGTDTQGSQPKSAQQITEEVLTSSQAQKKVSPKFIPQVHLQKLNIPPAAVECVKAKDKAEPIQIKSTAATDGQSEEAKTTCIQEPVKRQISEAVDVSCPSPKKQRVDEYSSNVIEDECIPDTSQISTKPTFMQVTSELVKTIDHKNTQSASESILPGPSKSEVEQPSANPDSDQLFNVAEVCSSRDQTAQPGSGPALVFSDEDDFSKEDDRLLSTQFNRQIDKVQMFLKLDRLRRPKNSV